MSSYGVEHAYFYGQMAVLCDLWVLFQLCAVRKQLFGRKLWFILIEG